VAFYDALETSDSAVAVLGDDTLKTIARELVEAVRRNVTIDWTVKESVRAKLRVTVRRILNRYGYPPDKRERATQTVLEQAELLCGEWTDVDRQFEEALLEVDDALSADDVLRIARVRGQAEAAILAEPAFDASRVAEALGSSSKNPREFARQARGRSSLVALRHGNRYVFPAFQFNVGRREVWPIVAEVNALLGAAEQPWAVASF